MKQSAKLLEEISGMSWQKLFLFYNFQRFNSDIKNYLPFEDYLMQRMFFFFCYFLASC